MVCLDPAAAAVPPGHRTIPGTQQRNGYSSCRALCYWRYVGLSLYIRDDQAGVAALAISLRGRVWCLHERTPMVDRVSGHGYGFFGAHGPLGTRLFLGSLCSRAFYGLGLRVAMRVITGKVFDGYTQPNLEGEAAR